MTQQRQYPKLEPIPGQATRPISFIVIRFSDEYDHNILKSECVLDARNQLITVDNRQNLFFENLGRAINAGLDQAMHEYIVVVHEDVLLVKHWEQHLFHCIDRLDSSQPNWGLLGCAGWPTPYTSDNKVTPIGHWSDPRNYHDSQGGKAFIEVSYLDEHLMVLRKSQGMRLDPDLPSIHNIGRDLPLALMQRGLHTFVINAPTIHKYADSKGCLIDKPTDSEKIRDRQNFAYKAEKSLTDDYFSRKWARDCRVKENTSTPDPEVLSQIDHPVILIGKGGGGSRLLSLFAMDLGLFLGNQVNRSGDALDLVLPVYRGVLRKYLDSLQGDRRLSEGEIRAAAINMLNQGGSTGHWGFKLPEAILLLPELLRSFPDARFIHMVRDPLGTCLRRTHMTARMDNQIGRVTLPQAYRHQGRSASEILEDSPGLHMAYTTRHQLEVAYETFDGLPPDRYLEVRFEHLIKDPGGCLAKGADWLGGGILGSRLEDAIDPQRALSKAQSYTPETIARMMSILQPVRDRLGYNDA